MKKILQWLLIGVALVGLVACGGGNQTPDSGISNKLESNETEVELVNLDGREVKAVKNEILIYLKEDVTQEEYDNIAKACKAYGEVRGYSVELRTMLLKIKDSISETKVIDEIKKLDGVRDVSLNELCGIEKTNINIKYSYTAKAKRLSKAGSMSSFAGGYWVDHIKLKEALDIESNITSLSNNVKVAIVDTGIPEDQDLVNQSRLIRYDYMGNIISDDNTFDIEDHGSWVTAFATGDKNGTIGVSHHSRVIHVDDKIKTCRFKLFGVCLSHEISNLMVLNGIHTAINKGADIINVSAGPIMHCNEESNKSLDRSRYRSVTTPAVQYAKRENVLIVFSSGNACEKHDDNILPSGSYTDSAASAWSTNTIIVGASNSNHTDADFSLMGRAVNLLAPGENVGVNKTIKGERTNSGTSFATPIVSGASAILKAINASLIPVEIKQILLDTASKNITFFDMSTSTRRGSLTYANATEPNLLLDVSSAAKTAKATIPIIMDKFTEIVLKKNDTKDVNITLKVPESTVTMLDIVFLVDTSGSYGDDINTLKNSAQDIIDTLKSKEGIDINFGVTSFSDFPIGGYGDASSEDEAYYVNQVITNDVEKIKSAINSLDNPLHYGDDEPESQLEALYQVATGIGLDINKDGNFDGLGELQPESIGWRTGAMKIILFATDAKFHDSDTDAEYPGHGKQAVLDALKAQGIQVIGLQSGGDDDAEADIKSIVDATKGSMFELSSDSSGITDAIISGMDSSLASIDIEPKILSGHKWISGIEPKSYSEASPGEEVTFKVTLKGLGRTPKDAFTDNIHLWLMGNKSAIMKRVDIPIKVQ